MNIADLTPEQQAQVLHHLRAATLAHALQWDHDRKIEALLDRELELSETIESLAVCVDADASTLTPEDLTFITLDNLAELIPDEDPEEEEP
jgi:hypothetical protein